MALGFLLPPVLVKDGTVEEIGAGLSLMFYIVAGICTVLFLAVLIGIKRSSVGNSHLKCMVSYSLTGFEKEPPLPPSLARYSASSSEPQNYSQSIKKIMRNRNYIILFITYGINVGVFYAMSTLLNQTVLIHFEVISIQNFV